VKKKSRSRKTSRKKRGRGIRTFNRIFLALTVGLIALYLLPLTAHVADDSDGTAVSAPGERITVRILNGCGEKGIALKATHYLRRFERFDVVEMKNAGTFDFEETEVVALTENREAAVVVRDALGFGRVVLAPDSTELLDVSVTLGSDSRNRLSGPTARVK